MQKANFLTSLLEVKMKRLYKISTTLSGKSRINKQNKLVQKGAVQTQLELIDKVPINHDSYIFKFRFRDKNIPLTIGKHIVIRQFLKTWQSPNGELVVRKYTPLSPFLNQQGLLEILIKIYRPNTNIHFPEGGKLTPYLENLKPGDFINADGPHGKFSYSRGYIKIAQEQPFPVKKLVFIAGGTGIAPIYNVVNQILKDKDDPIDITVLSCHKSVEDILLKQQMNKIKPRIKQFFLIDRHQEGWEGFTGYVRQQILEKITSLDEAQTFFGFSGPFLMNQAIRNIFQQFPNSKIFKF